MSIQTSRFAGKPWWQMPMATAAMRHLDGAQKPDKGEHGGECQRIACIQPNARWFNQTNARYYCATCARTFNDVSRRHGLAPLCELQL